MFLVKNGQFLPQTISVVAELPIFKITSAPSFGNSLLKQVDFIISNSTIETLYSQWLQIWKELNDDYV